jgi:K+-transporting ATPase A subunit
MSPEFVYVALLLGVLLVLAVPTGRYIAKVFSGERTPLTPLLRPIEKRFYSLLGIDENKEMSWKTYASALIAFNILSVIAVFLLQEAQGWRPMGYCSKHCHLLRYQHKLAGLQRRADNELFDSDAGADCAELLIRCCRNSSRYSRD